MGSPYKNLPSKNFWKTGVAGTTPQTIEGLYVKKFAIGKEARIATAGSCFAQHIARYLKEQGFQVLDVEPAPPGLTDSKAKAFGFNLYSARYGNIYFVRQLRQLAEEAFGLHVPQAFIWEKNGRYYDGLRPSVEPSGHASPDLVKRHRAGHIKQVRSLLQSADVFVFTMGLTEGWVHTDSGTVYPTAPGTIAGSFLPDLMHFHNFSHTEIMEDFLAFRELVKKYNKNIQFLLTVSPVPLTATATFDHVLAATTYSKSVLRGVAGELATQYDDIDYFPSYEIITSPFSKGQFFAENMRSITDEGVEAVMRVFFSEHALAHVTAGEAGRQNEVGMDEQSPNKR